MKTSITDTAPPVIHPSMQAIIDHADKLDGMVRRATSSSPWPDAPTFTERDFMALTIALGRTMGLCARQLEDAGFDTADVSELADAVVLDATKQLLDA